MIIEISGENDLELICPCFLGQRYEIFQGGIDRFLVSLVEVSKAIKESVHITNEYMDGYFLMMTAVVINDDINVWLFGDNKFRMFGRVKETKICDWLEKVEKKPATMTVLKQIATAI